MRTWVLSISLFLVAIPALAVEAISLSYSELDEMIRKNNKAVRATDHNVAAARQRIGVLDRSFYPKAGFEAGLSEQKEANGVGDTAPFWKVDVQANLYRGGRDVDSFAGID